MNCGSERLLPAILMTVDEVVQPRSCVKGSWVGAARSDDGRTAHRLADVAGLQLQLLPIVGCLTAGWQNRDAQAGHSCCLCEWMRPYQTGLLISQYIFPSSLLTSPRPPLLLLYWISFISKPYIKNFKAASVSQPLIKISK